ncbi:MAG: ParA family protein [Gammaproteobacteria bacterium]|nr:ParA family protein [Gammaproteobacteria bacterium]MDH5735711.1 ParA family protein [Gammaproteobacteria bacterium]
MKQTRVIAVLNQKGGVGKTTTTLNLVHGLARKGYDVLAIDLDPQGQLTSSLGLIKRDIEGLEKAMLNGTPLVSVTYPVRENLKLVPAGYGLTEVEEKTEGGVARGKLLKNTLETIKGKYDFILIDCPPSSGLLVVNALFAVNEVVIPMTGDYLALQGLSHLMATLKNFEKALGNTYKQWIVLGRYQARRRLAQEVKEKLKQYFANSMLLTEISESVLLAESPSFGKTIFEYKPSSRSAKEFESLVDDLIIGRTY